MHPEVETGQPGNCPKCGMKLVKKELTHPGEKTSHILHQVRTGHDHTAMLAGPNAASDFLKRFYAVTLLLIPLFSLSVPGIRVLNIPDFPLRPITQIILASIIFYYGLIFFQHAWHEIRMRNFGMMTLVSLGVGAGYLFSLISTLSPVIEAEFYLEISTLIWVLLFGHYLEARSSTSAGNALEEVSRLLPKEAHLLATSGVRDVDAVTLKKGDRVLVRPGEKVPSDGEIVKGFGNFDESHLTGESLPVEKRKGDSVSAGAINLDGSVEVRLSRVGESSTVGQIRQLVSQAQQTKPAVQRLADRVAGWLTLSALAVSLATLIVWSLVLGRTFVFSITLAITVLVIACPHALGLAIPTVSTIATRLAVNNGIFIKDMAKIESAKDTDYVIFDKTGTLTRGQFGVTEVKPFSVDNRQLLSIAASIENQSSHVIGQAIVNYAKQKNVPLYDVNKFVNLPGSGVRAMLKGQTYFIGSHSFMEKKKLITPEIQRTIKIDGKGSTVIYVADKNHILGAIILDDQIKDESYQTISQLHNIGIKVAMLTGDSTVAADFVAHELKLDRVFAQVLPQEKYTYVKNLQSEGYTVLMAGDGINDAPALTQANVGVAIGAGTDIALEAGDVILTQSNPQHVVRLIILSKKVYKKMIQNLFWAVGYNILAIPAAAGLFIPLGFQLTPSVGALLMSLSSVIVVVNALSIRSIKLKTA
ncbi:MAG: heavy metal translocating P-type ATPase [Patescibacteria group bacterium]